jgi:hypothetical protein
MNSQAAISARPGTLIQFRGGSHTIRANDTLNRIILLENGARFRYPPGHNLPALWIPFDLI